jgi:hypothetical protein
MFHMPVYTGVIPPVGIPFGMISALDTIRTAMKFLRCLDVLGLGWRRVGPKLSPETKRRVELLFRPEDQLEATGLLDLECGYSLPGFKRAPDQDVERVRFAALKLSDGDLGKLRGAVELAQLDFRDLLMNAGFGDLTAYKEWLPERKWTSTVG